MPAILNEAVPATTQNVDVVLQQNMKMAYKYTGKQSLSPLLHYVLSLVVEVGQVMCCVDVTLLHI